MKNNTLSANMVGDKFNNTINRNKPGNSNSCTSSSKQKVATVPGDVLASDQLKSRRNHLLRTVFKHTGFRSSIQRKAITYVIASSFFCYGENKIYYKL